MIKPSFALALAMVSISPVALFAEDAVTPPAAPAAEAAPDLSELDHAIPYGQSLLEKKDYETFFKTFVNPKLLEQMTKAGGSAADLAKGMEGPKGQNLLFAFKALKDIKPVIEDDGNRATYKFPEDLVKEHQLRKTELVFERVDKHWYIKN
jgi:hypothetical protein